MPDLTARQILQALAADSELLDEVLSMLDYGMWDEWDCGLADGLQLGFGPEEIKLAARVGDMRAEYLGRPAAPKMPDRPGPAVNSVRHGRG